MACPTIGIIINNLCYDNTGCGVSKRGIQNQIAFWQNSIVSRMKSLYFENCCNGEMSKSVKN